MVAPRTPRCTPVAPGHAARVASLAAAGHTSRMAEQRKVGKRLSSGAVVVRESDAGVRFLLLRAFDHWDFPKGIVEDGEEPLQAAQREIEEETTLNDLEFAWGETFIETGPYARGKTARYYIARTLSVTIELPINPELGRAEHSEFRWVDYDEAMKLTSPRVRPVIKWAANVMNL